MLMYHGRDWTENVDVKGGLVNDEQAEQVGRHQIAARNKIQLDEDDVDDIKEGMFLVTCSLP